MVLRLPSVREFCVVSVACLAGSALHGVWGPGGWDSAPVELRSNACALPWTQPLEGSRCTARKMIHLNHDSIM